MGRFSFGYDTGQISGFLGIKNLERVLGKRTAMAMAVIAWVTCALEPTSPTVSTLAQRKIRLLHPRE